MVADHTMDADSLASFRIFLKVEGPAVLPANTPRPYTPIASDSLYRKARMGHILGEELESFSGLGLDIGRQALEVFVESLSFLMFHKLLQYQTLVLTHS